MLEAPFAAALNRLLRAHPWARERLTAFAGDTVELRSPPLPSVRFTIREGGMVQPAETEAQAALVVAFGPELAAAWARGEEDVLRRAVVTGDSRLAAEVLHLARHLRWDAEEDLSRVLGDVAAQRLVEGARRFAGWQADAARRLADGLAGYVTEEARLLASRPEVEALAESAALLREGIDRLEKRIERLG